MRPSVARSAAAVVALAATLAGLGCEPLPAPSDPPGEPPSSASATAASASVAAGPESSSGAAASSAVPTPAVQLKAGGDKAVEGTRGMVASEDPHATRIGAEVLAAGGNAIDAAVAVGYALSVTHHAAGSLGGGGFMLVRLADGSLHAIDYREIAPAKATVALNEKQLAAGAHGYLSAPVPGVVAGLNFARERFGTKPLAELIAPSIALAKQGHPYGERQATVLAWFWRRMTDPHLRRLLGRGKGPIGRGHLLRQPELASTLEAIAAQGDDGFYKGEVAKKIAAAMTRHGGLVTEEDLASYRPVLREPLRLVYRGFEVYTMPPPSMGGIAVASILQNLAQARVHAHPAGSAQALHLFIEASRRAYADRRAIGADPAFVDQALVAPLFARLLDPRYHAERQPPITASRATPSSALRPIHDTSAPPPESSDTTHFSVADAYGNAVACTTTLSAAFGAWVVVPGTGVLLSNAMGGFSPEGVNVLEPKKRMASSMSPAIVLAAGEPAIVIGSPGGDTIPNTVAQVIHHLIDHRMSIDAAIEAGRVHHQYLPDEVRLEDGRAPSAAVLRELEKLGHVLKKSPIPIGDANGILIEPGGKRFWGYADSRKGGLALAPDPPPPPAEVAAP